MDCSLFCTPNTKRRKDIETLGPYAFILDLPKEQTEASSTTARDQLDLKRERQSEKNLGVFHKKGSKAQDTDARRVTRARQEADRKKDNRFQGVMDRRARASEMLIESSRQTNNSNVLKNAENNKVDSRREQLLRWKDQKAAAAAPLKNKKAPFKASSSSVNGSLPAPLLKRPLPGLANQNVDGMSNNANLQNKNVVNKNFSGPVKNGGGERRVTRAMSKGTTTTAAATCPYNVKIRPALAKLKNLSSQPPKTFTDPITKTALAPKSLAEESRKLNNILKNKVAPTTPSTLPKSNNNFSENTAHLKPSLSSTTTDNTLNKLHDKKRVVISEQPVTIIQETNNMIIDAPEPPKQSVPSPAPKRVVKKKGMQFDEVYVEYSNNFVAAGTALMHGIGSLNKVIQNSIGIPDDVLSDIESTLGQAKLLMDSKLPQFGQLLYFYLSKETNPNPILPCDLQGWWDVATIQVEKVKDRFNELLALEKNGWKKLEAIIPPVTTSKVLKSMKKSEGVNSSDSSSENKAVKAKTTQASSGLRQFLANKRRAKEISQPSESLPLVPEGPTTPKVSDDSKNKDKTESETSSSPIRKFEGGFFDISTPVRTSTTNPNGVRTPRSAKITAFRPNASCTTPSTPGSKSLPRASLVTLAVRKSMGSMFKTEVENELTHIEPVSDPQPMDSCHPTYLLPPRGSFSETEECSRLDRINMNTSLENSASADQIEPFALNHPTSSGSGGNFNYTHHSHYPPDSPQSHKAVFQRSSSTSVNYCLNYEPMEFKSLHHHHHHHHNPHHRTSGYTRSTNFLPTRNPNPNPSHCQHHYQLPSSTEADSDREFKTINLYSGNCENWYTETNSSSTSNSNSASRKSRRWSSSKSSGRVNTAAVTTEQQQYEQQQQQRNNGQKNPHDSSHHYHRHTCHNNNNHNNNELISRRIGAPTDNLLQYQQQYILRFNLKQKCTFSKSFHHFMDAIKQGDAHFERIAGTKKNRTRHRRRAESKRTTTSIWNYEYPINLYTNNNNNNVLSNNNNSNNNHKIMIHQDGPLPIMNSHHDHVTIESATTTIANQFRKVMSTVNKRNPGVIGDRRFNYNNYNNMNNNNNQNFTQGFHYQNQAATTHYQLQYDKCLENSENLPETIYFHHDSCTSAVNPAEEAEDNNNNNNNHHHHHQLHLHQHHHHENNENFEIVEKHFEKNKLGKYCKEEEVQQQQQHIHQSTHHHNLLFSDEDFTNYCKNVVEDLHSKSKSSSSSPLAVIDESNHHLNNLNTYIQYHDSLNANNNESCHPSNHQHYVHHLPHPDQNPHPSSCNDNTNDDDDIVDNSNQPEEIRILQENEEEEEVEELPGWSPFSYDQISIFTNSLLSSELKLIYSDWPKECLVVDKDTETFIEEEQVVRQVQERDEKEEEQEKDSIKGHQGASSAYISFLGRCLDSDGSTSYCEIFGAQNVMDLHPEFSPFDHSIDIEQSLVTKHLTRKKVIRKAGKSELEPGLSRKIVITNNDNDRNTIKPDTIATRARFTPPNQSNIMMMTTTTTTGKNGVRFHSQISEHDKDDEHVNTNRNNLTQSEVEEEKEEEESFESSTTDLFDEPEFSLPRSVQCKVCDIYHCMKSRRKLPMYTGIALSAECTNCGRFTDITSRREVRPSENFPNSSSQCSQPSSDELFQNNENGSD